MANVVRFQIRGDTAENWEKVNPVLLLNEPGYDRTARRLKIGDGVTKWIDLEYIEPNTTELMKNFMGIDGKTVSKYVYVADSSSGGGEIDPPDDPTPPEDDPIDLSSAHWEVIEMPTTMIGANNFVDYGKEIGKILFAGSRWCYMYDVQSGQCENFYNYSTDSDSGDIEDTFYQGYPLVLSGTLSQVSIDPLSKTVLRGRSSLKKGLEDTWEDVNHISLEGLDLDNGHLADILCLWHPKKQCFVVSADYCPTVHTTASETSETSEETLEHYQYSALIDINGNEVAAKLAKDSRTGYQGWRCGIAYSLSRDELLGITCSPSPVLINIKKSQDGLSWSDYKPQGIVDLSKEQATSVRWCEWLDVYVLSTYRSSGSSERGIYVYKSKDGVYWEHIYFIPYSVYKSYGRNTALACNNELKTLCLLTNGFPITSSSTSGRPLGFLTHDLGTWVEVDSGTDYLYRYGVADAGYSTKWSESLQSFVFCVSSSKEGISRNPMKLVLTK